MKKLIASLLLISMGTQAHDGHHEPGLWLSLWHLLSEPSHWVLLAMVVAASAAGVYGLRARNRKAKRGSVGQ